MGRRSRKRGTAVPRPLSVPPPTPGRTRAGRGGPARTRAGRRAQARPRPIWHPWPLTEAAIGLGLAFAVVGVLAGSARGAELIGGGVLIATTGVLELCVREHLAGFRSHTLLLSFLPVVLVHTVLRLYVTDAWEGFVALSVDGALFGALALLWVDRFRRGHP